MRLISIELRKRHHKRMRDCQQPCDDRIALPSGKQLQYESCQQERLKYPRHKSEIEISLLAVHVEITF